jgi:hypothetical protein
METTRVAFCFSYTYIFLVLFVMLVWVCFFFSMGINSGVALLYYVNSYTEVLFTLLQTGTADEWDSWILIHNPRIPSTFHLGMASGGQRKHQGKITPFHHNTDKNNQRITVKFYLWVSVLDVLLC